MGAGGGGGRRGVRRRNFIELLWFPRLGFEPFPDCAAMLRVGLAGGSWSTLRPMALVLEGGGCRQLACSGLGSSSVPAEASTCV